MLRQVPFIGREEELTQIKNFIEEQNSRHVLCILAPGGIGKTRLLAEIHNRYARSEMNSLLVADIIDFDDRTLHLPRNVERQIAHQLDQSAFEPYLRGLQDLLKMETIGVSSQALQQQAERVRQTFVDNLNNVSLNKRLVLLFDTAEKLEHEEVSNALSKSMFASKNTLFVLTGRPDKEWWGPFQTQLGSDTKVIELEPLKEESSQQYLKQKQRLLHLNLDPQIESKLLFLAGGRPILLDLAIEWISRHLPLDWMTTHSLEDLQSLSHEETAKYKEEFEIQLVSEIIKIRHPMDQLALVMSRIYPLTPAMLVKLLRIPQNEAQELFNEAQSYVFVKSLPDGRISLHDEMRRMVNEYVWLEVDPQGSRQRRDSRLATEYLKDEIQRLTKRIKELATEQERDRREANTQIELKAFTTRETLERGLWALREQLLFHTLVVDVNDGFKTFTKIFDDATKVYHFSFREIILKLIQKYVEKLTLPQLDQLDNRRVKYLLDQGKYEQASTLARQISVRQTILPQQQVDTLIDIANAEIRLGELSVGTDYFKKAVEVSRKNNLEAALARATNGLGWAYRLIGDLNSAAKCYRETLDLIYSSEMIDQHLEGLVLNNLAFVYAMLREHRHSALDLNKQALRIWEELDNKRQLGAAYNTRGSILHIFGQFEEAQLYFNKALDLFEEDPEWLSLVYAWRGVSYWARQMYEEAREDLEKAKNYKVKKDIPMIFNRLGRVYNSLNLFEKAREEFEKSHKIASDMNDKLYEIVSLAHLVKLDITEGKFESLSDYEEKMISRYQYIDDKRLIRISNALGGLYIRFGVMLVASGRLEDAMHYFKSGSIKLSRFPSYGHTRFSNNIIEIEQHLNRQNLATSSTMGQLGKLFYEFWKDERLATQYPEVLPVFARWKKWKE